jgi:hypothetical protein
MGNKTAMIMQAFEKLLEREKNCIYKTNRGRFSITLDHKANGSIIVVVNVGDTIVDEVIYPAGTVEKEIAQESTELALLHTWASNKLYYIFLQCEKDIKGGKFY